MIRVTTAKLILLLASALSGACVTLPDTDSPYYKMVKNDCYGQATLGSQYTCVDGSWVANEDMKPVSSDSRKLTQHLPSGPRPVQNLKPLL